MTEKMTVQQGLCCNGERSARVGRREYARDECGPGTSAPDVAVYALLLHTSYANSLELELRMKETGS